MHPGNTNLWKASKILLNQEINTIPPLCKDNQLVTSDAKKCNVFSEMLLNTFSVNQISNSNNDRRVLNFLDLPDYFVQKPMVHVTLNEIKIIIKKLPNKKAPGNDRITNIMFKKLPAIGLVLMTALFNSLLRLEHFPPKWKIATVILVKKPETCLSDAYKQSIEKHNESVKNNRYVLSRLIDATCFLAKQELSFRGHDEQVTSINRGNYVELIHLMGTLDPKLSGHLSTSTVFSGLSGDIQNDLIQSISNVLLKTIKNEIEHTNFVSIIMDETTDIMSKSQLSTILRYVTNEGVEEKFLGFVDVSHDRSAKCLAEHVFCLLNEYKCIDKLVAQTYDGAAVMSGHHNENGEKWDSETLLCAKGFCQTIQDFDFNFFLIIFGNILPQATILFNIIQTKIFDVTYCNKKIFDFLNHLKNMKNDFDRVWLKSEQYHTDIPSRSKRQRVAEVSVDRKTNYRRLYFEIIDVLISKTNERFTEITQLTFFSLLDFSKFEQYINQFPTNAMNSLKDTYGEYFDFAILRSELSIIYSSTEFHKVNIHELWMYLKSTGLSDSLPQVTKLASLIVTIPATNFARSLSEFASISFKRKSKFMYAGVNLTQYRHIVRSARKWYQKIANELLDFARWFWNLLDFGLCCLYPFL
ncbi:hypothetical protein QTP88_009834 [Uroleucon formosanum]